MAVLKSRIEITWYDGVWPSESGELTLLGADEDIDENSPILASIAQLVQRDEFVRGAVPAFYVRGSRSISLEWDRIRPHLRHDLALAAAFDEADAMPGVTGWVRIELPEVERVWVVTPCVVSAGAWSYRPRALQQTQRWTIGSGVATEIGYGDFEEGLMLFESGFPMLFEDGEEMAFESYT